MSQTPKLMIVGHGRHGKDTACEILRDKYGFTFESSSKFCSKLFIFDQLKDKYGYKTEEDCYIDRHNRRAEWFKLISDFCEEDAAALGKSIFSEYNIYCGCRSKRELNSMKLQGVFDYCVWVDRSEHLPPEDSSIISIEPWMADFIIDNNRDIAQLETNLDHLYGRVKNLALGRLASMF